MLHTGRLALRPLCNSATGARWRERERWEGGASAKTDGDLVLLVTELQGEEWVGDACTADFLETCRLADDENSLFICFWVPFVLKDKRTLRVSHN